MRSGESEREITEIVETKSYSTRRWVGKKYSCEKEQAAQHQRTHRRTKGGTISNKLQMCKKNAKAKGLEFDLTNAQLTQLWDKQGGKCALSGVDLGYIGSGWTAASVDRVDPEKGYTIDNIQWVCWRVNDAKSNMTNDDFITMCHAIAATSPYTKPTSN